jgi:hypothetical protein
MKLARCFVFLQVFGINAIFLLSTHLAFYRDQHCQVPSTLDYSTLALGGNILSSGCVQIPKMNTWNASSVSIENPQPCVIGVYQEKTCDNRTMIAYAMHWNGEPSCFPFNGTADGTYYASISCIEGTESTQLLATPTGRNV